MNLKIQICTKLIAVIVLSNFTLNSIANTGIAGPCTAPTVSCSHTDATCGLDNGTASVSPGGGNGSFTYLWSDPSSQTTATATGLATGAYIVTVTSGGCSATCSTTVGASVDATAPTISCAPNVTVNNPPGVCSSVVTVASPAVSDNCSLSQQPDQFMLTSTSHIGAGDGFFAQSFTSGISGMLSQVDVNLLSQTFLSAVINIYAGGGFSGGLPSGQLLYSQPITLVSNSFNAFVLTAPVYVTAGMPYTFQVLNGALINAEYNNSNAYAGGRMSTVSNYDFVFRTYVLPYSLVNSFNNTSNASGSYNVGITNLTWTVTDASGNTATCNQAVTMTVVDTEAPTINCAANITVNTTPWLCTGIATVVSPTVTDNCSFSQMIDQFMVTHNITANAVNGRFSQSFTAGVSGSLSQLDVDLPSQPGSLSAMLNIYSGSGFSGGLPTGPLLHSQPITLVPNTFNAYVLATPVTVTTGMEYTFQITNGGAIDGYVNQFNAYAGGNMVIHPQYDLVFRTYVASYAFILNNSFNNTENASGTYNTGVTNITWTATDLSGNTATCNQTVTVVDNEPPTIICAANVTLNNSPGLCTGTATVISPVVSDNCPFPQLPDQFMVSPNSSTGAGNGFFSQSFTAGITGMLSQVDVDLTTQFGSLSAVINIFSGGGFSGGLPAGQLLYSQPITLVPNTFNAYILTTPVNVTSGMQYIFQLMNGSPIFGNFNNSNAYAGGTMSTNPNSDLAFRTYVLPYSLVNSFNNKANASGAYNVGITNVTWTTTNGIGNTATCTQTVTVVENQPPAITCPSNITVTANTALCRYTGATGTPVATDNCGTVSITGASPSAPYSTGTTTVTWIVNDGNGNTSSCTQQVTVVSSATPTITGNNSICSGSSATLNAGSFVSYLWTGGNTTQTESINIAGTYTVTVTDIYNCTNTATKSVTANPLITIQASIINVACRGTNTGSVNLTVSGGTGAITYLWNNGSTNEDQSGLFAGTYNVTVTDASHCTATAAMIITQPATTLTLNVSKTNVRCGGKCTGDVTIAPSGGGGSYNYYWDNGSTSDTRSNLCAGTYVCMVTDNNGCTKTKTVEITANPVLIVVVVPTNATSATASASGGIPGYTYSWNTAPAQTNATATGLTPNTMYKVKVADTKSCTVTGSITTPASKLGNDISYTNSQTGIYVFPNPTTGIITLQVIYPLSTNYKLTLTDVVGRIVYIKELVLDNNSETLNFSNIAKGVYSLCIDSGVNIKVVKVIIE